MILKLCIATPVRRFTFPRATHKIIFSAVLLVELMTVKFIAVS